MSRDPLKQKIRKVLKKEFSSSQDRIVIKDGSLDFLYLYIVSPKFKNKKERDKDELVWSILFRSLTEDEWGRVSIMVPLSPKQAKEYWPPMPELNGR